VPIVCGFVNGKAAKKDAWMGWGIQDIKEKPFILVPGRLAKFGLEAEIEADHGFGGVGEGFRGAVQCVVKSGALETFPQCWARRPK
jgi:hypothetical protein